MLLEGFAGTYASAENKSLWWFAVDTETGILTQPKPVLEAADSKYLFVRKQNVHVGEQEHKSETLACTEGKVQPQLLAVPRKVNGRAGLAVVNVATDPLQVVGEYGEEQDCPAYVTGDSEFWYTANYHDGGIRIYKLTETSNFPGNEKLPTAILTGEDAAGGEKNCGNALANLQLIHKLETGRESGCHQIILAGPFLLACCLVRDQILIYDRTRNWQQVGTIDFPKGTGPRHGIFTRDGQTLFVVSELSNELFVFQNLKLVSAQPLLEQNDLPAAAAAIRLSPDEKFLYVSVRERNVICVFALAGITATKIQEAPCGGDHPRDLVLTPDGKFVLAVNRYPGSIVSFSRDQASGKIGKAISSINIPQAVSVVFTEGVPR